MLQVRGLIVAGMSQDIHIIADIKLYFRITGSTVSDLRNECVRAVLMVVFVTVVLWCL